VHGWYHDFNESQSTVPELLLPGEVVLHVGHSFRTKRADVDQALGGKNGFYGMVFEFYCPEKLRGIEGLNIEVYWANERVASVQFSGSMGEPPYAYLLNDNRVWHRDWVYCSGLPVDYINAEILALAETLSGPVLDLGCGPGGLTEALNQRGIKTCGLELDVTEMRKSIPLNRRSFIQLYDGSLPLPYGDKAFESVILSEVLEHLENAKAMMDEISRVCKGRLLVTVPDMSGLPLNHKNGVVPWHLLESTHVNFFNPTSLEHFLKKWFTQVELYRIGSVQTNATQWWGGLMALAWK
jgi:2-polyprenyl-3-methyl-5-hydroxy-6-metoxy-1,4-benzoquinol methylase